MGRKNVNAKYEEMTNKQLVKIIKNKEKELNEYRRTLNSYIALADKLESENTALKSNNLDLKIKVEKLDRLVMSIEEDRTRILEENVKYKEVISKLETRTTVTKEDTLKLFDKLFSIEEQIVKMNENIGKIHKDSQD